MGIVKDKFLCVVKGDRATVTLDGPSLTSEQHLTRLICGHFCTMPGPSDFGLYLCCKCAGSFACVLVTHRTQFTWVFEEGSRMDDPIITEQPAPEALTLQDRVLKKAQSMLDDPDLAKMCMRARLAMALAIGWEAEGNQAKADMYVTMAVNADNETRGKPAIPLPPPKVTPERHSSQLTTLLPAGDMVSSEDLIATMHTAPVHTGPSDEVVE